MLTSSFETADGLTIYTEQALPRGKPKALVLLVHGYGEHCGRYRHVIARLTAHGYAVFTLDHRGHGKSEGVRAYCDTLDQFVDDLKVYFDQVKAQFPDQPADHIRSQHGRADQPRLHTALSGRD